MQHRGVVYDVGLLFTPGVCSVDPFSPALVDYDMKVIAKELHASAVRIEGEDIERLVTAARSAHAQGLTVYFNPWKNNVGVDETRAYFAEAAAAAERLRQEGVDIVFVTGCELTIFTDGFFPGSGWEERHHFLVAHMTGLDKPLPITAADLLPVLADPMERLNDALRSYVKVVRAAFAGAVSYSAGPWETVDWSIFDIVGLDHYRAGETAEDYLAALEPYRVGKPLVVMEVGCCTYEGAGPLGAGGFLILQGVNPDGTGIWEGGVPPKRNETEQADYLEEQLTLLGGADLEAVFVFQFSYQPWSHHAEDAKDLDRVAFGIVKTFADPDPRSKALPPWEPKEAFHRVAMLYERSPSTAPSRTGRK